MMMGAPFHTNGADQAVRPSGREGSTTQTIHHPERGDKAGGSNPPPAFLPKSFFPIPMGAGSYKETFTDI